MRSSEEMKQLVRREAGRRRGRRRLAAATGAGAVALLLVGVTFTRSGADAPTDVSTATGTVPRSVGSASHPDPAPGTNTTMAGAPDGAADPVPVPEPGRDGSPTMPSTTSRPSASTTSTTADADADPDPDPDDGLAAPSPVPTIGATPDTTAAPADTTTTTDPSMRVCAADDFVTTDLQLSVVGLGDELPANTAPVGRTLEFGYSTALRSDRPLCWTPDALLEMSVTGDRGAEVFHVTQHGGGGRIVTPGSWVRFRGLVSWPTACDGADPWTSTCEVAAVGTYVVRLYDQGASLPPVTVHLIADG